MSLLRVAATSARTSSRQRQLPGRSYSSAPPPPQLQESPKNRTPLYVLGAALAAAGVYYYSANPERVDELKAKAKAEEKAAVGHAQDMRDQAVNSSKDGLAAARAAASDKVQEAKNTRDRVMADADARVHKVADDTQSMYDSAKNSIRGELDSARTSTENLYKDARNTADDKAAQASQSWSSWVGWGRDKAETAKEKAEDAQKRAEKEISKAKST